MLDSFLIKLQVFRLATLKRIQHRFFLVKFANFLRMYILKNISKTASRFSGSIEKRAVA